MWNEYVANAVDLGVNESYLRSNSSSRFDWILGKEIGYDIENDIDILLLSSPGYWYRLWRSYIGKQNGKRIIYEIRNWSLEAEKKSFAYLKKILGSIYWHW